MIYKYFLIFLSNTININRYKSYKQKLFGVFNYFEKYKVFLRPEFENCYSMLMAEII